MQEQTFCIIKPDAVSRGIADKIKKKLTDSGFEILESKLVNMTLDEAQKLYVVHKNKPFYNGLVKFITSGQICLMKLQREDAVSKLREIMGATDPRKAEAGTIRAEFKEENVFDENGSIKNMIHGSDSDENAKYELSIFF
ncbi:nucleoside-diphosphate kinase [candidate division WOR-1 bacterium RIFOXYA2_FULL_36_21]|uniref:Nucleoside-diphosphate kinase n=1 Tax=candidate division WOR-1 bacterium RIFOXYB2_FULL_36_35 TaxID=1802578 RepID=A0A1F4S4M3_UNCSA|nr:MAG: nucleoside-diphosphate kinase [candidate division WOR-1 bacterium RIFOXYA2_FULL_36_21]OGC14297.1 MAG: nucleoside-diphosphate kinase [candidate division WOR-1 bacterium RIFOXYA12_FULL_36_13]OGC15360.1 MAG: nucleoside-diphosphate kinase [candidate division WOR-1 bacterium RIFOXYB2_FULL_36_35]